MCARQSGASKTALYISKRVIIILESDLWSSPLFLSLFVSLTHTLFHMYTHMHTRKDTGDYTDSSRGQCTSLWQVCALVYDRCLSTLYDRCLSTPPQCTSLWQVFVNTSLIDIKWDPHKRTSQGDFWM